MQFKVQSVDAVDARSLHGQKLLPIQYNYPGVRIASYLRRFLG